MGHGEIWAVIPAGGSGTRFSASQDKLLTSLAGVPVLIRTLQALLATPGLASIVLAAGAANQSVYRELIRQQLPSAPVQVVQGGSTRRDSVYQGLCHLPDSAAVVVVHDAARPLIRPTLITEAIQAVQAGNPGAIVAVPMYDTVKQAHPGSPRIETTLDRKRLWRVQTPQVFQKEALLTAHRQIPTETPVTDDAQLLELADIGPVSLVVGDERNLKITTPADLMLAEALLRAENP